jgi:hypothetical protein
MRKMMVVFCFIWFASSAVSAQNSLCQIDLSTVTATLTRAQAAAARGEPEQALALITQADGALNAIEVRCNVPVVVPEVELEETYTSSDASFSVGYPAGWVANQSANGGSVTIGTDEEAATTLQTAEPSLNPGQHGVLIVVGAPDAITGNPSIESSLEGVIRTFQSQLAAVYRVRDNPEYFVLDTRPAAQFDFAGAGFDGLMIIVELDENGQYAVVAGAAATGELDDFRPTITSIAASVTQEG